MNEDKLLAQRIDELTEKYVPKKENFGVIVNSQERLDFTKDLLELVNDKCLLAYAEGVEHGRKQINDLL